MAQLPIAVSLKICQQTITEANTGRVTLVNCFRNLEVDAFPSSPQSFVVCCLLSDGIGDLDLTLEIMRLADQKLLVTHTRRMSFRHPLARTWYHGRLRNLIFTASGRYQCTLLVNGEWLAEAIVDVVPKGEKQ